MQCHSEAHLFALKNLGQPREMLRRTRPVQRIALGARYAVSQP